MTFSSDSFASQDRTQVTGGARSLEADFMPGQTIGKDYQVLAWIGAGGMGNVYRVRHTGLQAEYALKTLSADKITPTAWRRFQQEAQAIGRMNHPNIVGIFNLGLHEDTLPYYVMDLLKGQTLQDLIKTKGPLEVEEGLSIFIEVCAGLSYAHKKGFVHRDIKPPNIFIVEDATPGNGRVKIVDFGIAKLTGIKDETIQKLTNVGEICGSPYYMSPEQCDGAKIDARSDIYSLGCTLFETLTGTPPYRGRNAMDTMLMHQSNDLPSLAASAGGKIFPSALEGAVHTMMAKAPMDRQQTMDLLGEELTTILKAKDKSVQSFKAQSQTQGARRPAVNRNQLKEAVVVAPTKAINFNYKPIALAALALLTVAVAGVLLLPKLPLLLHHSYTAGGTSAPQFACEITDSKGKKQIVFSFPSDVKLGDILIDKALPGPGVVSVPCQGKQTIEAGHKLYFLPTPLCLHNPMNFYSFRPGYLTAIIFPPLPAKMKATMAPCLEQICKLKGLTKLDLVTCKDVSDEVLPLIDKCSDLTDLALNANYFTVNGLAQSKTIGRLNSLTYTYADLDIGDALLKHEQWEHHGQHRRGNSGWRHGGEGHRHGDEEDDWDQHKTLKQSITPLLETLAKSPNLTSLEMPNVPLLPEDIKVISKLKNLQVMDLSNSNMLSAEVETLSDMPNLVLFQVDNCLIDATAIPAFKKMAAHSLKIISMHSLAMTKETEERYRKELPDVQINP